MEKFSGQTHGVTHARTDVTHLSVRKFTSRSSKLLQTFQGLLKKAVDKLKDVFLQPSVSRSSKFSENKTYL